MSLVLGFLPELVYAWNTFKRWQRTADTSYPIAAQLRLDIPTMGCVACVNKVDNSIRQCKSASNIKEEMSWLTDDKAKGGIADVTLSARTSEEIDEIIKDIVAAVETAGFQCNVASLQVKTN